MEYLTFVVEDDDTAKRIDVYLSENIEDITRSGIQKIIENGGVKIGGKDIKSNYKLRKGDVIDVEIPEPTEVAILPEDIPLDIIFEDKDIIVLNKPQGMVVHPAPGHYTGTIVNALMYHCGDELSGINGVLRPGIVHRIDKDTSGVIMVAKSNTAHQSLALQLAEHSITRKYIAIVFNKVKNEEGTIDKPIARHPQERKKMAIAEKGGRRAVTHYRVLERLGKYTVIEAQLETGRTHQIRVHMASIGHPLVGDTVYGGKNQPAKLLGQALHARILGFKHPITGEYMEFEAPVPDYFTKLITRLSQL